MDWFGLIFFIVYSLLVSLLVVALIRTRVQFYKTVKLFADSQIEKEVFRKKLQSMVDDQGKVELEKTDGFINFVAKSRDWAFEYIDSVQLAIAALRDAPRTNSAEYKKAFNDLVKLLPDKEVEKK
jgi:hypothetical protein